MFGWVGLTLRYARPDPIPVSASPPRNQFLRIKESSDVGGKRVSKLVKLFSCLQFPAAVFGNCTAVSAFVIPVSRDSLVSRTGVLIGSHSFAKLEHRAPTIA